MLTRATLADFWDEEDDARIAGAVGVHQFSVWRWRTGRTFPHRYRWPILAAYLRRTVSEIETAYDQWRKDGRR